MATPTALEANPQMRFLASGLRESVFRLGGGLLCLTLGAGLVFNIGLLLTASVVYFAVLVGVMIKTPLSRNHLAPMIAALQAIDLAIGLLLILAGSLPFVILGIFVAIRAAVKIMATIAVHAGFTNKS